ncbi:GH12 family glycosyl hydrolase domain-containing protein [Azospirillum argentinense]|uniref:Glycosyl hydrolase family 12 n=1 Tax=Azospirillum brasilense TaxID=192 RepID=A0A4D8Q9Y2_AZOBR|nr:hypothetical protein [Azospirillum argentinense]QCO06714.1 hypothetical protein D3867_32880 [Azospirillum argentinense]
MTTTLKGSADRLEVGGWAASSNVWNPGGYRNGKDFTQSIAIDEATFPNGTVISWSWPYDSRRALTYENYPVRAYPELTHGVNPWNGAPSTSMDLPARIADLPDFDVTYKVGLTGATNLYNVAVSLWIGDDPKKGIEGVTDEVMVWLHSGVFTPAGEPIAKLTDARGMPSCGTSRCSAAGWTATRSTGNTRSCNTVTTGWPGRSTWTGCWTSFRPAGSSARRTGFWASSSARRWRRASDR